jgi:hypothetical protein
MEVKQAYNIWADQYDTKEYFDENDKQTVPRILTILFRKS